MTSICNKCAKKDGCEKYIELSKTNYYTVVSCIDFIKDFENADVLDKIKSEIEQKYEKYKYLFDEDFMGTKDLEWVLSVIDKYRGEQP